MKCFSLILLASYVSTMVIGLLAQGLLEGGVDSKQFLSLRNLLPLLIVLPFMETLLIHFMVIEIAYKLGGGGKAALYMGASVSAAIFFWLHYSLNGAFNGFSYGIPGAISVSAIYVIFRGEGRQKAFFSAWMLHLSSNSLLVLSVAFYSMALGVR